MANELKTIKTQRDGWQPIRVGDAIAYVRRGEKLEREGTVEVLGSPPNGDVIVRHDDRSLYGIGVNDTVVYVMPTFR
jgi:hypothetical protein